MVRWFGGVVWVMCFAALCGAQVTFTVFPTTVVSGLIPSDFCSFSIELDAVLPMFTYAGTNSSLRVAFVNLLNHLKSYNTGQRGPNIRVGGNSADTSEFVNSSTALQAGDSYRVSQAVLDALAAAVPLFNGTVIVGLNFRQNTPPPYDITFALAALSTLGNYLEALEIGNEENYMVYNGVKNASTFNAAAYVQQFNAYVSALVAAGIPLRFFQAPTTGVNPVGPVFNATWMASFVSSYKTALTAVCVHYYPLSVCPNNDGSFPSPSPTPALLLSPTLAASAMAPLPALIAPAVQNGLPFHIGEGDAVCCSGSNVTASGMVAALWTLDTMFAMAQLGVSRFNFHGGPTGDNGPVRFFITGSNPTRYSFLPSVNAPFLGMAAFTFATANGARLVQTVSSNPGSLISGWAVLDATGTLRVTVVHKDTSPNAVAAQITVSLPGTTVVLPAQMALLLPGPGGLTSTSGLTWMGISWDSSKDGNPAGTRVTQTVQPTVGLNGYQFMLAPYSAAILTISATAPTPSNATSASWGVRVGGSALHSAALAMLLSAVWHLDT
jgi:hypothetical protein